MSSEQPVRYAPERNFPSYAFIPGQSPHPTRDPKGHSFGEELPPRGTWDTNAVWFEEEEYLWGTDLYNFGYLWEAHEAWEGIWQSCKHVDKLLGNFLQGLIQCSAASLKIPMEQPKGLAKLSELGTGRLTNVGDAAGGTYWGLDVEPFVTSFRIFAAYPDPEVDDRPRIRLDRKD
ncbi:MAG: hypothetical protein ACI841_001159 [Planctomycetota bacterium]|jgi:hypothetical protein